MHWENDAWSLDARDVVDYTQLMPLAKISLLERALAARTLPPRADKFLFHL